MAYNAIAFKDEFSFVKDIEEDLKKVGYQNAINCDMNEIVQYLIIKGVFKDEVSIKAFLLHNSLKSIQEGEYDFPINIKINEEDLNTGIIYTNEINI